MLGDAEARGLAMEAVARHGRRVVPLLIEQLERTIARHGSPRHRARRRRRPPRDRRAARSPRRRPEVLVATRARSPGIGDPPRSSRWSRWCRIAMPRCVSRRSVR
jgi:hypothetical protein